ncbi:MAG: NADH-quinone oxidoreductase subunit J [Deltaproteobacteria bacterium]|nr:NADH-quinone oxidoreductase subunit J [Deltaproteobacteria bacterium]
MSASELFFYGAGALAVVSALGMVANVRNTVAAAMCLVVTMISLAVVFVVLEAHLVAALQIMVYAGAIVVVFLFVVMLLNLRRDTFEPPRQRLLKAAGTVLTLGLAVVFLSLIPTSLPTVREIPEGFGGYRAVGAELFTRFVLPFEVTSLLILAAVVGAVVLAKRRLD